MRPVWSGQTSTALVRHKGRVRRAIAAAELTPFFLGPVSTTARTTTAARYSVSSLDLSANFLTRPSNARTWDPFSYGLKGSPRDRLPACLGELHPHDQPAGTCVSRRGQGEASEHEIAQRREFEAMRKHGFFSAAIRAQREDVQCPPLFVAQVCHCTRSKAHMSSSARRGCSLGISDFSPSAGDIAFAVISEPDAQLIVGSPNHMTGASVAKWCPKPKLVRDGLCPYAREPCTTTG
jgi:hypothetical protein